MKVTIGKGGDYINWDSFIADMPIKRNSFWTTLKIWITKKSISWKDARYWITENITAIQISDTDEQRKGVI